MVFGQVVIGPPGSGKTTYCNGMSQFLKLIGRCFYLCLWMVLCSVDILWIDIPIHPSSTPHLSLHMCSYVLYENVVTPMPWLTLNQLLHGCTDPHTSHPSSRTHTFNQQCNHSGYSVYVLYFLMTEHCVNSSQSIYLQLLFWAFNLAFVLYYS